MSVVAYLLLCAIYNEPLELLNFYSVASTLLLIPDSLPLKHLKLPSSCPSIQLDISYLRYVTQKTYLFPRIRRIGFPKVAARKYAAACAAIRGSSARHCADALRISKKSADERASLRTRSKTGIGC